MLGSHLSIAGSMTNALDEARALGLDCVQVFTKNQQQWKVRPLEDGEVARWSAARAAMGWAPGPAGDRGQRVVSHASYLINLASAEPELHAKSVALMREEIERCQRLGIGPLVFHPGAHTTSTREEGLARVAAACADLLRQTAGYAVTLCFENVAGAGSTLGRTLEELADLRRRTLEASGAPQWRVGFCIDTCHAHAAGYDLSSARGAREFLDGVAAVLGEGAVRVLHLNDSKGAAGSRLDRHEHIGRGRIGETGFAEVVRRPTLRDIPWVMETPKDGGEGGKPWDAVNAEALRRLMAGGAPRPTPPAPAPAAPRKAKPAAADRPARPARPGPAGRSAARARTLKAPRKAKATPRRKGSAP